MTRFYFVTSEWQSAHVTCSLYALHIFSLDVEGSLASQLWRWWDNRGSSMEASFNSCFISSVRWCTNLKYTDICVGLYDCSQAHKYYIHSCVRFISLTYHITVSWQWPSLLIRFSIGSLSAAANSFKPIQFSCRSWIKKYYFIY